MITPEELILDLEKLRSKVRQYAQNGGCITKLNADLCGLVDGSVWNKQFKIKETTHQIRTDTIRKDYPNSGRKWSESDNQLLLDLFTSGINVGEISQRLGRTSGAIQSRLVNKGLMVYENGVYKQV